jgi:GWxTD domain-containing protein
MLAAPAAWPDPGSADPPRDASDDASSSDDSHPASQSSDDTVAPGDASGPGTSSGVFATALQPGVSSGDFEFYVDAICQRPAGPSTMLVRCLVQLPVRDFLEQTKNNRAELRLRAQVFDASAAMQRLATAGKPADKKKAGDDSARAALARSDEAMDAMLGDFSGLHPVASTENRSHIESADRKALQPTDFRLIELGLEVPPGDYVLEVMAQNLSRRKRGLLDRLRRRPMEASTKVLVRVPDLRQPPGLADAAFLFGHGKREPYATRLYGLMNDSLHVRTTLFAHGEYVLRVAAADRSGDVGWRDSLTVNVDGARDVGFDATVNSLPAGQYVLRISAAGPEGRVENSRSFDVAWSLVTWKSSRRDLDLEAELALDEKRYDEYRNLPVGEKERYLEKFWKSMDPSPDTAQNEVHDEFERRVAYADLNFSETIRGSLTDRGRVYIHFGAPDEIMAEAVPTHLAGRGAEEALDKVDDVYVAEEHDRRTNWDWLGSDNQGISPAQRAASQQERNRVIGPANEVTSYELWRYAGGGQPLMPEDKGVAIDTGLRVMFVDLDGYGRYRIRKSSIRLNIHGLSSNS